jgi:hypothetical protein
MDVHEALGLPMAYGISDAFPHTPWWGWTLVNTGDKEMRSILCLQHVRGPVYLHVSKECLIEVYALSNFGNHSVELDPENPPTWMADKPLVHTWRRPGAIDDEAVMLGYKTVRPGDPMSLFDLLESDEVVTVLLRRADVGNETIQLDLRPEGA